MIKSEIYKIIISPSNIIRASCQHHFKATPESSHDHSNTIPTSFHHQSQITPKTFQSHSRTLPKASERHVQNIEKDPKAIPEPYQKHIKFNPKSSHSHSQIIENHKNRTLVCKHVARTDARSKYIPLALAYAYTCVGPFLD